MRLVCEDLWMREQVVGGGGSRGRGRAGLRAREGWRCGTRAGAHHERWTWPPAGGSSRRNSRSPRSLPPRSAAATPLPPRAP